MLLRALERWFFFAVNRRAIKHVRPPSPRQAEGLVRTIYQQMARDFTQAPPAAIHYAEPQLMAGLWSMWREAQLAGPVDRGLRHLVGAVVSEINRCPFCVEANSILMYGSSAQPVARRLLDGQADPIGEPPAHPIAAWARATLSPGAPILDDPPFPPDEAPEYVGTALVFHYLDRMVDVFLHPSPIVLPRRLEFLRPALLRLTGHAFGSRIGGLEVHPGASLDLFDAVTIRPEYAWMIPHKLHVARALSAFAAAVDEAAARHLPARVREVVGGRIARWEGQPPGVFRGWVDEALDPATGADLAPPDRALARLMLLTALAPYQITDQDVETCQPGEPAPARLVTATAWAAFRATERVGAWILPPWARPRPVASSTGTNERAPTG